MKHPEQSIWLSESKVIAYLLAINYIEEQFADTVGDEWAQKRVKRRLEHMFGLPPLGQRGKDASYTAARLRIVELGDSSAEWFAQFYKTRPKHAGNDGLTGDGLTNDGLTGDEFD